MGHPDPSPISARAPRSIAVCAFMNDPSQDGVMAIAGAWFDQARLQQED
jgi:hypothetical protein